MPILRPSFHPLNFLKLFYELSGKSHSTLEIRRTSVTLLTFLAVTAFSPDSLACMEASFIMLVAYQSSYSQGKSLVGLRTYFCINRI